MICYAVIDTNVLVSALLSSKDDTATVQVLGKVITGEIIPVYSNVITKEYREVLSRRKFGFSGDLIEYLMSAIEKYGILVDPSPSGITLPDMKDILSCIKLTFHPTAVLPQIKFGNINICISVCAVSYGTLFSCIYPCFLVS